MGRRNGLLLLAVVLLAGFPLLLPFEQTKIFQSADGQVKAVIEQTRPDYQPWFTPIWTPPSAEIEGLLFALQAALGAGVLGYCIGHRRGKAKGREATRHDASD